jgi:hypothetical protein
VIISDPTSSSRDGGVTLTYAISDPSAVIDILGPLVIEMVLKELDSRLKEHLPESAVARFMRSRMMYKGPGRTPHTPHASFWIEVDIFIQKDARGGLEEQVARTTSLVKAIWESLRRDRSFRFLDDLLVVK